MLVAIYTNPSWEGTHFADSMRDVPDDWDGWWDDAEVAAVAEVRMLMWDGNRAVVCDCDECPHGTCLDCDACLDLNHFEAEDVLNGKVGKIIWRRD